MNDKPRGEQPLAASDGGAGSTRVAIIEDRREIREGLRRLQEHNLVDRYLQM